MYSSDFKEYLESKTNVDFQDIDELFEKNSNVFDTALALINLHGLDKAKLGKIWGDYIGFAYVDPNSTIVNLEYVNKLGIDFVAKNKIMPLYKFGRAVTVATSDPDNPFLQDKLEKLFGEIVSLVFCFPFDVDTYLKNM